MTDHSAAQDFQRWFTDYPSTHVKAGETVEVTPVAMSVEAERDALRAENERLKAEALDVYGIVYGQLTADVVDDHDRIMRAANEVAEAARRLAGAAPPLARPSDEESNDDGH